MNNNAYIISRLPEGLKKQFLAKIKRMDSTISITVRELIEAFVKN